MDVRYKVHSAAAGPHQVEVLHDGSKVRAEVASLVVELVANDPAHGSVKIVVTGDDQVLNVARAEFKVGATIVGRFHSEG